MLVGPWRRARTLASQRRKVLSETYTNFAMAAFGLAFERHHG